MPLRVGRLVCVPLRAGRLVVSDAGRKGRGTVRLKWPLGPIHLFNGACDGEIIISAQSHPVHHSTVG